jgi:hypothetical protein
MWPGNGRDRRISRESVNHSSLSSDYFGSGTSCEGPDRGAESSHAFIVTDKRSLESGDSVRRLPFYPEPMDPERGGSAGKTPPEGLR